MKYLLSLPRNLVKYFHNLTGTDALSFFCTSDPADGRVGSGGGTVWLLDQCRNAEAPSQTMREWLPKEKRILIHAGGSGRRIPAYATSGKVLTPIPVVRAKRGQKIDQTLLELQLPLYERLLRMAPERYHTLVASGDVMIRATELPDIPEADVVCLGLWQDPSLACHHGVFMIDRQNPHALDYMLQKPSAQQLDDLLPTHFYLMDVGVWLLSDKAVERLAQLSGADKGQPHDYDLYAQFGTGLGTHPSRPEPLLKDLSVAILPLDDGSFLHYGTTPELLSSTVAVINDVKDQRHLMYQPVKPHPSIFTQNAVVRSSLDLRVPYIWIENAYVPVTWNIPTRTVITGVPVNNWVVRLSEGQCVDMVPVGENDWCLRPYGYADIFSGSLEEADTMFMEQPFMEWAKQRGIALSDFSTTKDIQRAELFPVCSDLDTVERLLTWFISDKPNEEITKLWRSLPRLSADGILNEANLQRADDQRKSFRALDLMAMADNYSMSVFYSTDLHDLAHKFVEYNLPAPHILSTEAPLTTRIHDAMFRSQLKELRGEDGSAESKQAFNLLRDGMVARVEQDKSLPRLCVLDDQIVWGRSPVRADVAGGWTDTPPFSLYTGGNVVNMALNLNGQPPLQVYVKPNHNFNIVCRSIDLGAEETVSTFEELSAYEKVGSPFSIPKAAMALAGFLPRFCKQTYPSLRKQLEDFGSGIDIVMMAAVPAGSGLGTSSILAATVLGALSDFCGLGWSKHQICNRTLVLEQLLTTGGGWQDQYGGVLHGIKMLRSQEGFDQNISTAWLPDPLFRHEQGVCHLLYYTGIRRTAKKILQEIVRGMFLNDAHTLSILNDMKEHALNMQDAIQHDDFAEYGALLHRSWELNCQLDSGTAPQQVEALCSRIDDLCLGYKLLGAGGGGFMYMVAKDPEAALRLRSMLQTNPLTPTSRFVEMTLSDTGMQITRS